MLRTGLLIALTTAAVGGAITGSSVAGAMPQGSTAPSSQSSSPEQRAVSAHLRQRGALFYGAWWCPACTTQKQLFGPQASETLPYVECDKSEAGRQRCIAAKIRAFPTWELEGKRLEGVQSVEELKRWSGYTGGRPTGN